jgi:hypothetical protein
VVVESRSAADTVGGWAKFFFGAIIGAFTFVGIQGAEVSTIIRNERSGPGIVAGLAGLVLVAIVASFYVGAQRRASSKLAWWSVIAAATLCPLLTILLPTTNTRVWTRALLVAAVLAAASLAATVVSRRLTADWPAEGLAIMLAALFMVGTVYGGLRLESRSQARTTNPRITAAFDPEGRGFLHFTIRASKLSSDEFVTMGVYGLPRVDRAHTDQLPCAAPDLPCLLMAGKIIEPDSAGEVEDEFTVPFDGRDIRHINVIGCVQTRTESEQALRCGPGQRVSLDLSLPE